MGSEMCIRDRSRVSGMAKTSIGGKTSDGSAAAMRRRAMPIVRNNVKVCARIAELALPPPRQAFRKRFMRRFRAPLAH